MIKEILKELQKLAKAITEFFIATVVIVMFKLFPKYMNDITIFGGAIVGI